VQASRLIRNSHLVLSQGDEQHESWITQWNGNRQIRSTHRRQYEIPPDLRDGCPGVKAPPDAKFAPNKYTGNTAGSDSTAVGESPRGP
jgi:hypothetical protein